MRLPLAVLSLGLSSVLVSATPPPDMIDAIEAAKLNNLKRDSQTTGPHRNGDGSFEPRVEKKWVVLPSSALPGNLRPAPHHSIFHHRPSSSQDAAEPTAMSANRIHKVVQRRAPPPQAANITESAAAASATPTPSGNITDAAMTSVNPFDPFTWPQAVNNQYTASVDQFHNMSALSKVGLAAICTVAAALLLFLLVCTCKISRSRKRRRADKLSIKAEAERRTMAQDVSRIDSRSTTGSSSRSYSSNSPSSINSEKKSGGGGSVFGWMKKKSNLGDAGEAMPDQDRLREMQQNSLTWDPRRAKSWDARAKGTGGSPNLGRGGGAPEPPQAPGGSMKTRSRSYGGPMAK